MVLVNIVEHRRDSVGVISVGAVLICQNTSRVIISCARTHLLVSNGSNRRFVPQNVTPLLDCAAKCPYGTPHRPSLPSASPARAADGQSCRLRPRGRLVKPHGTIARLASSRCVPVGGPAATSRSRRGTARRSVRVAWQCRRCNAGVRTSSESVFQQR